VSLLSQSWTLLKSAINGFIEDEALTRGAAIAFYTATSFAPVLLIVIAIAGLVYGREAAQGAITAQLAISWVGRRQSFCRLRCQLKEQVFRLLGCRDRLITLMGTASSGITVCS
jgi:hypothetical protein